MNSERLMRRVLRKSLYGDPLDWSGTSAPTPATSYNIPNIRLTTTPLSTVSLSPTTSGNFDDGIWNGNITVNKGAKGIQIYVEDGDGHYGSSNVFDVKPDNAVIIPVLDLLLNE